MCMQRRVHGIAEAVNRGSTARSKIVSEGLDRPRARHRGKQEPTKRPRDPLNDRKRPGKTGACAYSGPQSLEGASGVDEQA